MLSPPPLTRAAMAVLRPGGKRASVHAQLDGLVERGFNTIVVPLLRGGELSVRRGASGALAGPPMEALAWGRGHGCSLWLSIDPLTAAGPGGHLASLAREHREWLMRNTSGHLTPLGSRGDRPLLTWMNMTYRRMIGDIVADLAAEHPFAGFLVDMRAWPGQSDTARRWYCCSFESQLRAEEALSTNFEYLLAEGTQSEIEAWQSWVRAEMRSFVEHLMGRVRVHRTDATWRVLVPPHDPRDPRESPWSTWLASELFDEVILESGTGWPWSRLLTVLEEASASRPVAMAAVGKDDELEPMLGDTADSPFAGFLHLAPTEHTSVASLAPHEAWTGDGAPQDRPREAAFALASWVRKQAPLRSAVERYLRRALPKAGSAPATAEAYERLRLRARELEDALQERPLGIPEARTDLRRDLRLALRLAATVEPDAAVY